METYSPLQYLRTVKKIKSLLKNHYAQDVLDCCLSYLNQPTENSLEDLKKHPWLILLIVKWAFLNESSIAYRRKKVTNADFNRIIQKTHSLGGLVKLPSGHAHLNLFMRNISYQQFIYQNNFSFSSFSRQWILFTQLADNHNLKRQFREQTGISIDTFLNLSLLLCSKFFNGENKPFFLHWFSPISRTVGWQTTERFLHALSVERELIAPTLKRKDQSKGGWQEFYEQTPFVEFPLIREGEKYTCVHPMILFRALENHIYDQLKRPDPTLFMGRFGKVFEAYLKQGVDNSGLKYTLEEELVSKLPDNTSCVDYIIHENRANIFIDAKAVEMPYLGKISDTPQIIQNKVKNSATKAISQAYSINDWIFSNGQLANIKPKNENYVLVVTFKELFLSNGKVFYDAIAKKSIDKILRKTPDRAVIPLENIYFITVDEFDFLMELERNNQGAIVDLLRKAVIDDREAKSRKFDFSQHLHEFGRELTVPSYLKAGQDEMFRNVEEFFPNS